MKVKVKKFTACFKQAFSVNTYIVSKKNECVIIDLGVLTPEIKTYLEEKEVLAVLLTHGHIDHINGLENTGFPVYISSEDRELLSDGNKNFASNMQIPSVKITNPIKIFKAKETFFDSDFNIIKTPGHTKGSVCIRVENFCFTGDTLFYDSVGRTDLYGGSASDLNKSLKKLLKILPNEIMIHPGHERSGKFYEIKQNNFYLA